MWNRLAPAAALLALGILVLGAGIGSVPLTDPDEARYAATSRNMLDRNDYVIPWFNGVERINKPALFYWLQAASMRLIGASATAARLPSALAALAVLFAVYGFAHAEIGAAAALRAGAILLGTPLFLYVGKAAVIDMTLHLCQVCALLLWYRLYRGRGNRRAQWLGISLLIGFAMLAKGPVGVLVPCLVIALFLALRGDWRAFRPKGILLGALVAIAVFLPWAGLLVWRLGSGPAIASASAGPYGAADQAGSAHGIQALGLSAESAGSSAATEIAQTFATGLHRVLALLRHETIDRALSGLDHPQPFWYFLAASLLVFFPWSAFLPPVLIRSWTKIRARDPAPLFLFCWIVTVYVFFSLVKGKLITYILPAAPPIALLLALEWPDLRPQRTAPIRGRSDATRGDRPLTVRVNPPEISTSETPPRPAAISERSPRPVPAIASADTRWVLLGAILLAALTAALTGFALTYRGDYQVVSYPGWILLSAALILIAAFAPILARRPGLSCYALSAAVAAGVSAILIFGGGEIGLSRSLRDLVRDSELSSGLWERVVAYKLNAPSLVFYGHRDVVVSRSAAELGDLVAPGTLIVLERRRLPELERAVREPLSPVAVQRAVVAIAPAGSATVGVASARTDLP